MVEMPHDPGHIHMAGCNYQKDFSFSSWQRTLFIFVIGTIGQKLISHWKLAEKYRPEQLTVT